MVAEVVDAITTSYYLRSNGKSFGGRAQPTRLHESDRELFSVSANTPPLTCQVLTAAHPFSQEPLHLLAFAHGLFLHSYAKGLVLFAELTRAFLDASPALPLLREDYPMGTGDGRWNRKEQRTNAQAGGELF